MKYNLTYLKDSVGNNYVGIKVPLEDVQPHLEKLKDKNIPYDEDIEILTNILDSTKQIRRI